VKVLPIPNWHGCGKSCLWTDSERQLASVALPIEALIYFSGARPTTARTFLLWHGRQILAGPYTLTALPGQDRLFLIGIGDFSSVGIVPP